MINFQFVSNFFCQGGLGSISALQRRAARSIAAAACVERGAGSPPTVGPAVVLAHPAGTRARDRSARERHRSRAGVGGAAGGAAGAADAADAQGGAAPTTIRLPQPVPQPARAGRAQAGRAV